ncbi:hypothetical protein CsSME_00051744 [Camellia sinensis var. sinensis]
MSIERERSENLCISFLTSVLRKRARISRQMRRNQHEQFQFHTSGIFLPHRRNAPKSCPEISTKMHSSGTQNPLEWFFAQKTLKSLKTLRGSTWAVFNSASAVLPRNPELILLPKTSSNIQNSKFSTQKSYERISKSRKEISTTQNDKQNTESNALSSKVFKGECVP